MDACRMHFNSIRSLIVILRSIFVLLSIQSNESGGDREKERDKKKKKINHLNKSINISNSNYPFFLAL